MDGVCDGWEDISPDLIDRFIDVTQVEQVLPRGGHGWRGELLALDEWMRVHHARTLVTARSRQLREYLHGRLHTGLEPHALARLLACLGRFYRYLWQSGCRKDLLRIAPICIPPPRPAAHNVPAIRLMEGR